MKRRLAAFLAFVIIALSLFVLFFGAALKAEPRYDYYIACGCGCCGASEPVIQCLYGSNGDSIESVVAKDKAIAKSPECPKAGCSMPIKYEYCD